MSTRQTLIALRERLRSERDDAAQWVRFTSSHAESKAGGLEVALRVVDEFLQQFPEETPPQIDPSDLRAYEVDDGEEQHYLAAPDIVAALEFALSQDLISEEIDEVEVSAISESRAAEIPVSRKDDGLPPSTVLEELRSSTQSCLLCSTVY